MDSGSVCCTVLVFTFFNESFQMNSAQVLHPGFRQFLRSPWSIQHEIVFTLQSLIAFYWCVNQKEVMLLLPYMTLFLHQLHHQSCATHSQCIAQLCCNKATKSLCKKCVKSIHKLIQLNKRKTAANFQHNKTFSFVVLCNIYSLVNQAAKNVLSFLFPFE